MLHHFKIVPFAAGIIVGLFLLFFYTTPPLIVYQYPRPEGKDTRIYKDKNASCYSYSSKEVSCDANEGTLKQYPIQG
jgi:hypothetical protein